MKLLLCATSCLQRSGTFEYLWLFLLSTLSLRVSSLWIIYVWTQGSQTLVLFRSLFRFWLYKLTVNCYLIHLWHYVITYKILVWAKQFTYVKICYVETIYTKKRRLASKLLLQYKLPFKASIATDDTRHNSSANDSAERIFSLFRMMSEKGKHLE